jgi:hypothetical protein
LLLAVLTAIAAVASARAEYSDCRDCHNAVAPDAGASDYTDYFLTPGHHPVRVSYPLRADFHAPTTTQLSISFFDRDGDGSIDTDEIQIFRSNSDWIIDCASCHIEHGTGLADPQHPPAYVRDTAGDRVCTTCHNL